MTETTQMPRYATTVAAGDRGNVHLSEARYGETEILVTLDPICGAKAHQKLTHETEPQPPIAAFEAFLKATTLTGPYNEGGIAPWRCSKCWDRGLRLRYPERAQ